VYIYSFPSLPSSVGRYVYVYVADHSTTEMGLFQLLYDSANKEWCAINHHPGKKTGRSGKKVALY